MTEAERIVIHPEGIEIPAPFGDLKRFRAWASSDEFPERGRIDYLAGTVEVDMSPEDITTHGTPKNAISFELTSLIERTNRGIVLVDRGRLTSVAAGLSCEPDVMVILLESVDRGRARLIPKKGGTAGRYREVEGSADLVVEIVSDSSAKKDTRALRELYHAAGVPEYWIVDVRSEAISFSLLVFEADGYAEAKSDADGFLASRLLGRSIRLVRVPLRPGIDRYHLEVRAPETSG